MRRSLDRIPSIPDPEMMPRNSHALGGGDAGLGIVRWVGSARLSRLGEVFKRNEWSRFSRNRSGYGRVIRAQGDS